MSEESISKLPSTTVGHWTLVAALLALYFFSQFGDTWWIPFINEDYSFLDMTRDRTVLTLWREPGLYAGPWFRPWSQGIHYGFMQALFGSRVELWHVVHACLWLAILLSYYALAARLGGQAIASIATACLATSAGWGLVVTWIAGIQDLWMLFFALATLNAIDRNRLGWGALTLGLALASKETAATIPVLGTIWSALRHHEPWRIAFSRTWPLWAVLVVWFVVHPTLGARRLAGGMAQAKVETTERPPTRTAPPTNLPLQPFNLDLLPRPERGWGVALVRGVLGAVPLAALVLVVRRGRPPKFSNSNSASRSRIIASGIAWAALGWLPLLMPGLGWHGYYALLGTMGFWFAIAPVLARSRIMSVALIVVLLIIRAGRATTPSHDWGEESYVRRAGDFLTFMRSDLQSKVPNPKPHSRFFFDEVPSEVGFLVGDAPSLRVWYRDPTLSGGFYGDFRTRSAGSRGDDYFFRYDSTAGWVRVVQGRENVAAAQRVNPRWARDHELVAIALALGGDWPQSAREYAKLAQAYPDTALFAYFAGSAALSTGDTVIGRQWLMRAARLPSATDRMKEAARSLGIVSSP